MCTWYCHPVSCHTCASAVKILVANVRVGVAEIPAGVDLEFSLHTAPKPTPTFVLALGGGGGDASLSQLSSCSQPYKLAVLCCKVFDTAASIHISTHALRLPLRYLSLGISCERLGRD